jgi:hypothetical protein
MYFRWPVNLIVVHLVALDNKVDKMHPDEMIEVRALMDYKIPVVTNEITETKTETIVQKPKGIYLGAGVNSLLKPSAAVSYLDNKYLFQYQYQPLEGVHQIGVSKKLF